MLQSRPVSLAARERLREHQGATSKAVAAYGVARTKLDAVVNRRIEVLRQQDALVAAAADRVREAILDVIRFVGLDSAAVIPGMPKSEIRRATKKVDSAKSE